MINFTAVISKYRHPDWKVFQSDKVYVAANNDSYLIAEDGPSSVEVLGRMIMIFGIGGDSINWIARSFSDEHIEAAAWLAEEGSKWIVLDQITDEGLERIYPV